jgi:hypothetical protein
MRKIFNGINKTEDCRQQQLMATNQQTNDKAKSVWSLCPFDFPARKTHYWAMTQ